MKKTYIIPTTGVFDIKPASPLAASLFLENDDIKVEPTNPIEGDAGAAAVRELNLSDIMWTIVFLLFSITASAQTYYTMEPAEPPFDYKKHSMIIHLWNGTTVSYELKDLDHVTYLSSYGNSGIGMKVYLKGQANSVDYLFIEMESIEYAKDDNENSNPRSFGYVDYPESWRLEYPHLSPWVEPEGRLNASCSQIIVRRTDDYGITYSLEWDNSKVANRWTCYELHAGNTLSAVGRKDDFKADPDVVVSPTLDDYKNSGFSRGHLCPSADRLCSVEQNKQTFYLTNMHPQYQSHNGGLWSRLETLVRDYATNDEYTALHCDTLYVVKAATITNKVRIGDDEEDGIYRDPDNSGDPLLCNKRLLVPRYFYMALLHYNKETDSYHAIAFWTEHIDGNQSVQNLADYAISINELEKRTGIDFFCNLPDVIEDEVEAREPDLDFWKKITRSSPQP